MGSECRHSNAPNRRIEASWLSLSLSVLAKTTKSDRTSVSSSGWCAPGSKLSLSLSLTRSSLQTTTRAGSNKARMSLRPASAPWCLRRTRSCPRKRRRSATKSACVGWPRTSPRNLQDSRSRQAYYLTCCDIIKCLTDSIACNSSSHSLRARAGENVFPYS